MAIDFDSVLDHLGHFGRYQLFVMVLVGICQIFGGMHMNAGKFLNPMFHPQLKYQQRCFIDNCDNSTTKYSENFVQFALPKEVDSSGHISFSSCEKYISRSRSCTPESFSNETVSCDGYVWDKSEYEETAVSEFNIVCKKSWNGATSQSVFMGGVLLGSAVFGVVADKFGRKTVILSATLILLSSSIGTAFAPNFKLFSTLRFVTAAAISGIFQTGYVVAIEFVGTSKRLWCANIMQIIFAVGELLLSFIAYFVRKWRVLELAISVPATIMLIYYWLLPESVRWLVSKGKHAKAKKTVLQAARWNNKVIPEHLLTATDYTNEPEHVDYETQRESNSGPLSLFKTKQLRKWSLNIFLNWIVNAMVYYGLSLSAANLSGNSYLNFAILSAVEIPAVLLATIALTYCGRRWVLCIVMVFGGVACGSTIFVPQALGWLTTLLSVLGKSAIAASFAIIYIYSAEIYPTVVRSTGIGLSSMFARLGSIIAPIINELRKVYKPLPMIVFSIASIVAGVLALYLPETHNRQLPETIEEAERFSIGRMNDVLNVPRSRLLGSFSSVARVRNVERRFTEERQHLMTGDA